MQWRRISEINRSDSVWSKVAKHSALMVVTAMVLRINVSNSVLLMRCDGIGDFTIWVDAATRLVSHYRQSGLTVTLLANTAWAEFARNLNLFDDVIEVDIGQFSKQFSYRWAMARKLRKVGFQIAVQSMHSRTILTDMMIHLTGARERLGVSGDLSNIDSGERRISDRWYTRLIPSRPQPAMEAFRNAELVSEIIGEVYEPRLARWHASSRWPIRQELLERLSFDEPYYILHPGASSERKRWPIDKFRDVARVIWEQTGWRGLVCGGPGDQQLADDLCSLSEAPLVSVAGQTTLSQLVGIISRSSLLVSNDTSAAHIGAAVRTPTVCISGGWHYGRFWPYPENMDDKGVVPRVVIHQMPCFGCNWDCPYVVQPSEPVPCVGRIRVEDVVFGVRAILIGTNL